MNEYKLFLFQKILVLSVNFLVLVALTLAMYLASLTPEEFTLVFLKVFSGALLPILALGIGGKLALRRRGHSIHGNAI